MCRAAVAWSCVVWFAVFPLAVQGADSTSRTPDDAPAKPAKVESGAEPGKKAAGSPAESELGATTGSGTDLALRPAEPQPSKRTELNLLGKVDTAAGESRRNENIQFNLVDNNALKELNVRLGVTATIIQDFHPERSYFGSEFGNAPTTPLAVAPRPGSGFHGNVYESHLNSIFSARSFFQVGEVKPAHDNDYGFTLGGPAWRNARFFVQASQQKLRGYVNGNVLVPTPDERTPLATDPEVRAIVTRFLDAYPAELPNRPDVNPRALNTNSPQAINNNNLNLQLDQMKGEKDRFTLLYMLTTQKVQAFQLVVGQNPDTKTTSHKARIDWNRQWSGSTMIDLSVGFDRLGSLLVPEPNAVGPYISTGGLQSLGPDGTIPIDRELNLFRYAGGIRQQRGSHNWSAGFEVLRRQLNGVESDAHRGFFSFTNDYGRDSITNLRLGTPTQYIGSFGDPHRGFRNWDLQFYVGDLWRVSRNLTLNYSLRYQPSLAPYEVNDRNIIPYGCDCNNFAPTFGFAYRLPAAWGVLRGGYGLHYGEIYPVTYQQVRFSPPGNYKIVIPAPSLTDPLGSFGGDPTKGRPVDYRLSDDLVVPYSHQYNFTWEREIARGWNLQAGYVGSRSHKLLLLWFLNRARPVPGIPQTTATINDRRPNQQFSDIRQVVNGSDGFFDAARVSVVAPQWRRLSLSAAYWFSKAIDLGSAYSNTAYDADGRDARSQAEGNQHEDMKGLSNFDQPHSFLGSAAYMLPGWTSSPGWIRKTVGNWTLFGVVLLKTGTPFTVRSGSDAPGYGSVDGISATRPNLLDLSVLGRTIGDPDTSLQMLPRSAFAFIQPTDSAGSLGRNVFRKGGISNVNAGLSRTWVVRAEKRFTFRAESINFFNTPQFAAPGSDLANANFGQVTNTLNDGRTFRFLVQFAF